MRRIQPDRIDVLLVGGDLLFREGLKRLFAESPVHIVGDLAAPDAATQASPDAVVILESAAGTGGSVSLVHEARRAWPEAKVIILSGRGDGAGLAAALAAGVDGYLLTAMSPAALAQALNLVVLGENVFPTRFACEFVQPQLPREIRAPGGRATGLTAREIDILEGLLAGKSNKMIANTLGTTDATVKAQLRHLLRKIGADNRTQAALWARENGLPERPRA